MEEFKMFIWNKKIEVEICIDQSDLDKFIESKMIKIHDTCGYLGTLELLKYLKAEKLLPKYIKSYAFKLTTIPFCDFNTYRLFITYTQKVNK